MNRQIGIRIGLFAIEAGVNFGLPPLIYQLARAGLARKSPSEVTAFEAKRESPRFRRIMVIMTLVWGIGLLASSAIACALVFTLSIHDYMIVSPFVGYGSLGALALWTAWYRRVS